MSDLWAQFPLGFVNVSWSTSTTYPYKPDGPVDDKANSLQIVDSKTYLVSVSTSVFDDYTYGEPLPSGNLSGIIVYLYNQYEGYYPYSTWNEYVSASLASPNVNLSALNDVIPSQISDENFQNEVIDFGSAPYDEPFEGFELAVNKVENTIQLPSGQVPTSLQAPAELYDASAFDLTDNIYYPQYVWVDLGSVSDLFTSGSDIVDFNNLTPNQIAAVNGGADLYSSLDGNDVVTLPNVAHYQLTSTVAWDPSRTFTTGDGNDTITGGDGSYNIALGNGTDTVTINGNGASSITLGSGSDKVAITGNGANTVDLGGGSDTVSLSGTGNNTISAGSGTSGVSLSHFGGQLAGTTSDLSGGNLLDVTSYSAGTAGSATIGSSGTLELATAFAGSIEFGSPGGTLAFDGPGSSTGVISGFAAGDSLDFTAETSTSFSEGYLACTASNLTATTSGGMSTRVNVGQSNDLDYVVSNDDKKGGSELTAESSLASDKIAYYVSLLLDLQQALVNSAAAIVFEGNAGKSLTSFKGVTGPIFTAFGALVDSAAIYARLQTRLSQAGTNETAISQAIAEAYAESATAVAAAVIKMIIVDGAEALLDRYAGTAVGVALTNTLTQFLVGAGLVTSTAAAVEAAPFIATGAAIFGVTNAFNIKFLNGGNTSLNDLLSDQLNKAFLQFEHLFDSQPQPPINTPLSLNSGQSALNILVASGGELTIGIGASASGTLLDSGGVEDVYGSDASAVISDGGQQIVYGTATGAIALDPGIQTVAVGGTATGTALYGGEQDVYGTAIGTTVNAGGHAIVYAGGTLTNATIDGGSVELKSGAIVSGALTFTGPGGILQVDDFASAPSGAQQTDFNSLISGFGAGDTIRLEGFGDYPTIDAITAAYDATTNVTTFTLTDGGSTVGALQLSGEYGTTNIVVRDDPSVPGAVDISAGVTVAEFVADRMSLGVPPGVTLLADTAANIEAMTPARIAAVGASNITSVSATDASLSITAAQAAAFELAHIALSAPGGDSVSLSDTAAHFVLLTLAQVQGLKAIGMSSIFSTDAGISFGVPKAIALESEGVTVSAARGGVTLLHTAAELQTLTASQIQGLPGIGVTAVQAMDTYVTLTVAQALAFEAAGLKIATPPGYWVRILDTAAHVDALTTAQIAGLKAVGVARIRTTDVGAMLDVAQAEALESAGVELYGPLTTPTMAISDSAADIEAMTAPQIAGLATLGAFKASATDASLSLGVAQALAFETAGIKLFAPNGDSVGVSDHAASIEALTPAQILGLGASRVSAIDATDANLSITAAQAAAFESAHIALSAPGGDSVSLSDTAAHIVLLTLAQVQGLKAIGVSSIFSTDAGISLGVPKAIALESEGVTVSAARGGVTLLHTAAELQTLTASQIQGLPGIGVTAVQAMDTYVTLTVAQALAFETTGLKIATPPGYWVRILDTAAHVDALTAAQIAGLKAVAVARIRTTDVGAVLDVAQAEALESAGVALYGPLTTPTMAISDSAADIEAMTAPQIAGLATLGASKASATDASLSLGVAQALAFETAGIKLFAPNGDSVGVSDHAASIEALTPAQILGLGASRVSAIDATDASLSITAAQAAAFESAHIALSAPSGDSVGVSDTAAHLAALTAAQLAALPKIGVTSLNDSGGNVSFSAAQTSALLADNITPSASGANRIIETFADGAVIGFGDDGSGGTRLNLGAGNGLTVDISASRLSVTAGSQTSSLTPHATAAINVAAGLTHETFVFGSGFGADTISGFAAASHDLLQFSATAFGETSAASQSQDFNAMLALASQNAGGSAVIADQSGDTVTLTGVSLATLQANPAAVKFV